MYPAGAAGTQAAPQGPAGPTTSPAYSSYQPTPTQGYQVGGEAAPSPTRPLGHLGSAFSHCLLPSTERGFPGPTEPPGHLPASTVQHHGLHGEPVSVHGLPALRHAGERPWGHRIGGAGGAVLGRLHPLLTAPRPLHCALLAGWRLSGYRAPFSVWGCFILHRISCPPSPAKTHLCRPRSSPISRGSSPCTRR